MLRSILFSCLLFPLLACTNKAETESLLPPIPHTNIQPTSPRFEIRMIHIDVARHFFSVEVVERYIDTLARYNFNYIHMHLMDDQGWRLPIEGYEKLINVGSKRIEPDGMPYEGHFTQAELKHLVAYAQKKGITLMPEFDVPGHCRAALAAYPELSCKGAPQTVGNNAPSTKPFCSTLCIGNPKTMDMVKKVIDTLCDIYPSPYIHLGGDECDVSPWKTCEKCQSYMKKNKLKNEREIQTHFMNELAAYLHSKGRTMVAWDEYTETDYPPFEPKPIIMVWQGSNHLQPVLDKGFKVIYTPADYSYLDYAQGVASSEPTANHQRLLSETYRFPTPDNPNIIGGSGCLWAEQITNESTLNYMVFPRALALAEIFQHGNNRLPWSDFSKRVLPHVMDLNAHGWPASASAFQPIPQPVLGAKTPTFTLKSEIQIDSFYINIPKEGTPRTLKATRAHEPLVVTGLNTLVETTSDPIEKTNQNSVFFYVSAHKGVGALDVKNSSQPDTKYNGQNGVASLADGLHLRENKIMGRAYGIHYKHPFYTGYRNHDSQLVFYFKFDRLEPISSIIIPSLNDYNSWIFAPEKIEVIINGKTYPLVDRHLEKINPYCTLSEHELPPLEKPIMTDELEIRITPLTLPKGHFGAGQNAWTFLSEIIIL